MLVDTDVFIWFIRGSKKAAALLDEIGDISISSVTYIELIQGVHNKKEIRKINKALEKCNTEIIHIDIDVSTQATRYVSEYFHGHSLQLADALIGATAIAHDMPLVTGNYKHFSVLKKEGLELKRFSNI